MSESTQEVKPSSQYERDSLYYRHERDDEIDLVELFMKIWNRKWWVILAGTLTTGIALAYALLATPIYQVSTLIMPPNRVQLQSVESLPYFTRNDVDFDVSEEVFNRLLHQIDSLEFQTGLWTKIEMDTPELQQNKFSKRPIIDIEMVLWGLARVDKNVFHSTDRAKLTIETSDPISGVIFLNQLVEDALSMVRQQVVHDVNAFGSIRLNQIDYLLTKEELRNDVALLTEYYGLSSVNIDDSSFVVGSVEKKASIPKSPIKPKKTLIVLLGGVLGGMLGVFVALVVPARKEAVSA